MAVQCSTLHRDRECLCLTRDRGAYIRLHYDLPPVDISYLLVRHLFHGVVIVSLGIMQHTPTAGRVRTNESRGRAVGLCCVPVSQSSVTHTCTPDVPSTIRRHNMPLDRPIPMHTISVTTSIHSNNGISSRKKIFYPEGT